MKFVLELKGSHSFEPVYKGDVSMLLPVPLATQPRGSSVVNDTSKDLNGRVTPNNEGGQITLEVTMPEVTLQQLVDNVPQRQPPELEFPSKTQQIGNEPVRTVSNDQLLLRIKPIEEGDDTLIERAKQGDSEAYTKLYRKYHGSIVRYIRTRGAGQEDAEDIAQETFFRGWINIQKLGGRIRPWLYNTAKRAWIDVARHEGDRSNRETKAMVESGLDTHSHPATPDFSDEVVSRLSFSTDNPVLYEILRGFNSTNLEIFILYHVNHLSQKDIGKHSRITETAVNLRLFRMRQAIISALKSKGYFQGEK